VLWFLHRSPNPDGARFDSGIWDSSKRPFDAPVLMQIPCKDGLQALDQRAGYSNHPKRGRVCNYAPFYW
jgi:hypothetical protein